MDQPHLQGRPYAHPVTLDWLIEALAEGLADNQGQTGIVMTVSCAVSAQVVSIVRIINAGCTDGISD